MKTNYCLIVVTLVALLSSCAIDPVKRKEMLAPAKTVAIVTSMGREVELEYIGFTVFNNIKSRVDISNWSFDERVLAIAKQAIGSRLEVRTARYDSGLKRVNYKPREYRDLPGADEKNLDPILDQILKDTPVDIVFIISQWPDTVPLRVASNRHAGQRVQIGPALLTLIDAKTRKEIYGKPPQLLCDLYKFNFDAKDLPAEVNRERQTLERLWSECTAKNLTAFLTNAGL